MINSWKKFGIPDPRALRFDCTDFIFDKRIGVGGVGSFKNNFELLTFSSLQMPLTVQDK